MDPSQIRPILECTQTYLNPHLRGRAHGHCTCCIYCTHEMFTHRCFLADVKDLWEEVKNRSGGIIFIYFLFPCVFCDVYKLNKVISHNTCFWTSFHTWRCSSAKETCVISFFPHLNPQGFSSWKSAGKWPAVSEIATWCQHFHCLQGWLYKGLLPEGSWPQLSDLICSADSSSGNADQKVHLQNLEH